jgi:hypothetical protein
MTSSSTLSNTNASQHAMTQDAMTDVTEATMTEPSPFASYAGPFDAAEVAPAETGRFAAVRDQIRAWVEAKRCHYVAVGPGKVIRPRVFVAEVQTRGGTSLLTHLFPAEEQRGRRFGVGDRLVAVLATVWENRRPGNQWEDRRRARKCYLFRQPEERSQPEGNRPDG